MFISNTLPIKFKQNVSTHLLTPDRDLTINQNMDITKDQLGEPMSCIGVTCTNKSEGFLTGVEMVQRQHMTKANPVCMRVE